MSPFLVEGDFKALIDYHWRPVYITWAGMNLVVLPWQDVVDSGTDDFVTEALP